jgi:hypothetical protein
MASPAKRRKFNDGNGGSTDRKQNGTSPTGKKHILLNAFDMFTPSHLSFGQWRRPEDRSRDKRRDLTYWTDLAQILERGDITALFLADTYGQHDVYKGDAEPTLRTACQFPMGDPAVVSPIHCIG